ncbi:MULTISPECIES: hypothetical protein [Aestuariibaculum]|uniref:Uncharacterized protein n=1 Tax=Aestuariibaculum marinum TaxID=2683592 RepID=A0A8J6U4S2_9FLAO|nr:MULTISPECIES: hypothetical protein [Aestuariibaculum]MBD0824247.1 hypothetical protein [Aestuariibaculum marinum]WMI66013.1 hypothetical protein RBH94_02370 [Aestuariibaculum sp. YM273]
MLYKLLDRPYLVFWLSIPIIILNAAYSRNDTMQFNVYDTYYIFSRFQLFLSITIAFAFMGLGYWIMHKAEKCLYQPLSILHITLTFGGIFTIWIISICLRVSIMQYNAGDHLTNAIYLVSFIVLFSQIVYPINIIKSLFKN